MAPETTSTAERRAPPAGLVTFLFTDIEGSTELLHDLGDVYRDLLDHHDAVLRGVWFDHGGYEVSTQGDAFFVAFDSADRALAACLDAQQRLRDEPWPHEIRMQVRMGLHAGLAAPRHGDYIALAVHQAARVVNAAHGGQVIVTAEVLAAARQDWTDATVDLGLFRVRSFPDAIRLFQVADPSRLGGADPRAAFPPPRVSPAQLHNLVRPPGSFVGRDDALASLDDAVGPGRVVTVVGPGGVGKTRLCTEFAFRVLDRWPDGVRCVELAPLEHHASIAVALAATLRMDATDSDDLVADLLDHLASRSMLLIVDNAEHLVVETARLVRAIGDRAPGVGVLVTSREPLGLRGEQVLRLAPLAPADAARLFVDRARSHLSSRPIAIDDRDVHALCHRLDGLPLALEMAAARTEVFSAAEILRALDTRIDALTAADPTIEVRHRSMAELLRWSEHLLDDRAAELLGRISVYAGSFSTAGARALLHPDDGHGSDAALDEALFQLTRKSLLHIDDAGTLRRYRLLQVVRDQVRSRRSAADQRRDVASAGRWLADRFGPEVPADDRWANELTDELDNLRRLAVLLATDDTDVAGHLAAALVGRHLRFGEIATAVAEITALLDVFAERTWVRVQLLVDLAWCRMESGDHRRAAALLDDAEVERRGLDPPVGFRHELDFAQATLLLRTDRAPEAVHRLEALGRGGDETLTAGERMRRSDLIVQARVALGDRDGAAAAGLDAVTAARATGSTLHLSIVTANLAECRLAIGDHRGAARRQLEALGHDAQLGAVSAFAHAAALAAVLSEAADRPGEALWLQVWADTRLTELGASLHGADRTRADALVTRASALLGPAAAAVVDDARRTAPDAALHRIRATLEDLSHPDPTQPEDPR